MSFYYGTHFNGNAIQFSKKSENVLQEFMLDTENGINNFTLFLKNNVKYAELSLLQDPTNIENLNSIVNDEKTLGKIYSNLFVKIISNSSKPEVKSMTGIIVKTFDSLKEKFSILNSLQRRIDSLSATSNTISNSTAPQIIKKDFDKDASIFFYANLFEPSPSDNLILTIREGSLRNYVSDIGQKYKIQDTTQIDIENSELKINAFFKYLNTSIPRLEKLDKKNNAPLNKLFYFLLQSNLPQFINSFLEKEERAISIYESISSRNPIYGTFKTKIFPLLNNLKSLYEWWQTYSTNFLHNEDLKNEKDGFIAEEGKGNKLRDVNGQIAFFKGKISIAKKIYEFFLLTNEYRFVSDEELKRIVNGQVMGLETKLEFEPDFWQKQVLIAGEVGKSFILSGPTSGGKTALSMIIAENLMSKNIRLLYIAPTDQLSFQVYANMKKTFEGRNLVKVGICNETLDLIPDDCNFLIGTPKDLNSYLYHTQLTGDKKKLIEILNAGVYDKFDVVIIDEIHTMSPSYDTSIEGQKRAKTIYDLLSCVKTQFIGLSATLSEASKYQLISLISNRTQLNIESIQYTFEDIGKRDADEILIHPVIRDSAKYFINYQNKKIIKEIDSLHSVPISKNFLFDFFKAVVKWGKIPHACFPGTESGVLSLFTKLVEYLRDESLKCKRWIDLKTTFERVVIDRKGDSSGFIQNWIQRIYAQILDELSDLSYSENIVLYEECDLIPDFINTLRRNGVDSLGFIDIKPNITPELYGLIYEVVNFSKYLTTPRIPFSGQHPFFRFTNAESRLDMFNLEENGKPTRFGNLLSEQNISVATGKNDFVDLIIFGIQYGVGMITSVVPFAIQCELLAFLKKNETRSAIPIIFCDYGMSQGINLAFRSTSIIKESLTPVLPSIYFQIKGRAGRRDFGTDFEPDIYLINVENGLSLNVVENASYDYDNLQGNFYTPEQMISSSINMIKFFISDSDNLIAKNAFDLYQRFLYIEYIVTFEGTGREQIRLVKLQFKEIFDRLRRINGLVTKNYVKNFFSFFQNTEFKKIKDI